MGGVFPGPEEDGRLLCYGDFGRCRGRCRPWDARRSDQVFPSQSGRHGVFRIGPLTDELEQSSLSDSRFGHLPRMVTEWSRMTVDTLKDCNKKVLAQMAKDQGIAGWHAMRKDQLIRALSTPPPSSRKKAAKAAPSKAKEAAESPAPPPGGPRRRRQRQ